MRHILLALLVGMVTAGLAGFQSSPQTSQASVALLDRKGERTTAITDGNEIRLEATFASPVTESFNVSFRRAGQEKAIARCTIAAASRSCRTEPFTSLGWYWGQDKAAQAAWVIEAVDARGTLVGKSDPIRVAPRPVVLVHGFVSSWETWKPYLGPDGFLATIDLQGFAVGDEEIPGQMNTGNITNPRGRTNTIADNAGILAQYIEGVKRKTGAEMVDLVAHSMGGMIARYYIDRVMQGRDVGQLIMLGSPMGGSQCSALPASLGFYLPASVEILPSYMLGVFNQQVTHRHGVPFYDLAGTAISRAYKSPCADIPNDTVVSTESVNAIRLNSMQFDIIHTELTSSGTVFESFVRPLLQRPAETFAAAPDEGPIAPASSPVQFTRIYRGHVEPGGSTELTINIEPNLSVASFALYDPTRSTDVSVRGASGKLIQLDPEKNGFIRINDPASMFYLGYGFQNPKPGPWKVTVLATGSTPAKGADFAISVYFVGGAILEAKSDTLIPGPGQAVRFSARLLMGGQPLEITKAELQVRHPDGALETLDFQPGTQVTESWTPRSPGIYEAEIAVTGKAPDNLPVERTAFLAVEAQPAPSRERVTANLSIVIGIVLFVLTSMFYLVFRITRRLFRGRGQS